MHKTFPSRSPMKFPKVLRVAYAKIWSGKYTRIIMKGPRGGGKSMLLGAVGFDLWYLKERKVVTMGGSFVQAAIVYNYFTDYVDIDADIKNQIEGECTMTETKAKQGHSFCCVTASPKQVRGKHPDVLMSDETAETSDELIYSALPMVNDSKNPLVVMASTFHKIFGVFQETWDNAEEMGYHRISWDIFDVCFSFDPAIWEREDVKKITGIEKLRAYAKGRCGDPEGWVPIENVIQAWREKSTESWFEVEYLGLRPSAAGLIFKPEDVDAALFDSEVVREYNYLRGANVSIGIDWGFSSMTAVTVGMGYKDGIVALIDNKNYHQVASDDILNDVVDFVKKYGVRCIYADSAGKFENVALQNKLNREQIGCSVIEVVFSKEKEKMLGNTRGYFEQRKFKLPKKFKDAYYQIKNYRYQEGTDKPVKKDDHIPDSLMCMLQHFPLGQVVRPLRVQKTEGTKESERDKVKPITAGHRNQIF